MQKKEEKKEEAYFSPGKCVVFKTMCNSHRFIVESYCRWDLGWDLLLSLLGISSLVFLMASVFFSYLLRLVNMMFNNHFLRF